MNSKASSMILIVMGVSGSGKSTVGRLLAEKLRWTFVDADDFHSPESRLKMQKGIPLTDEDRAPWLETLSRIIATHREKEEPLVLACSALRKSYRSQLGVDENSVPTVYLKGSRSELQKRLAARKHAFFNPALLDSQLATLEEPDAGLVLPIELPPDALASHIIQWINNH